MTANRKTRLIGVAPSRPFDTPASVLEDWVAASPAKIQEHLSHAQGLNSGGWFVVASSQQWRQQWHKPWHKPWRQQAASEPWAFSVGGVELVAWRTPQGEILVAPDRCPHLGARLSCGRVDEAGALVCPWHGLKLQAKHGAWATLPVLDDGHLVWVQVPRLLKPHEHPTPRPMVSLRPQNGVAVVVTTDARCDPKDVIANRLDPWHGAHFHPHSFEQLAVLDEKLDELVVRVVYRVMSGVGVEVDATFRCPDPRTITMKIVGGEGTGSIVETHATPLHRGMTRMTELTIATTERAPWLRRIAWLLRPFIRARSLRLWKDDVQYCERLFELRTADEHENESSR